MTLLRASGFFELYLGAGSTIESVGAFRLPNAGPVTQVRYDDWGLWDPTRQVGYAIGLEKKTFDDFKDPKVFGNAMNKSHKLLFNCAIRSLIDSPYEEDHERINATMTALKEGVVVVGTVAHLLAGFLLVVALCLAGVLLHSCSRCNNLCSDPDTLATKMSLVDQSPQLLRDFEGVNNYPNIRTSIIERRRYKLGPWDGEAGHRSDILDAADVTPPRRSHSSSTKSHEARGVRPWELSGGMGVGNTIFIAGLLVLLAALFRSSQKYSGRRPPTSPFSNSDFGPGLPALSEHELAVQFVYSFIPTVAAILIEPVWVVVTRYLARY